jgi:enediyne biosynthesis protein E4
MSKIEEGTWILKSWRNGVVAASAGFLLMITLSCHHDGSQQPLFEKIPASQTGITFVNKNDEDEAHNILMYEYFYNGGGVALGDINNDDLTDIYFTSNQGSNKLYLNKGNLIFEDITAQAKVSCKDGWKTGVTMVDVNHDGWLDIYVCKSAENHPLLRENVLYINNHDLTFDEKAQEYGLNDGSYSTQAVFFDFDKDADLDVFILNHSLLSLSNSYNLKQETNNRFPHVGNRFLKNHNGRFIDVSDSIGVYGTVGNYGLGVAVSDLDNDGWLDIYASNDYTGKDKLLMNRNGGHFIDAADSLLTHMSQFSMGVDIADINNDGLNDIITLDMLPASNLRQKQLFWPDRYDVYEAMVSNGRHHQYMRNMLHLNSGNGMFSEIGQIAGVSSTDWSWSALFADYDNDGLQDLFVTNGYKRDYTNNDFLKYKADAATRLGEGKPLEGITDFLNKMPSNKISNYVFKNLDGLSFSDQSSAWGVKEPVLSNGAAYGDLDNDGDLDIVTNNMDEAAGIYINHAERLANNFLKIRLIGKGKNTFGIGTKVTLYFADKLMTRTIAVSRGFQSSVEPLLHFGLGQIHKIDSVVVEWSDGELSNLSDVAVNQTLTLHQESVGKSRAKSNVPKNIPYFGGASELPYKHQENKFTDFKVQALLPRKFSTQGPALAISDVNKDGLTDIFIGGSKDARGAILVQRSDGSYTDRTPKALSSGYEDVDALFFDIDNDHDDDLYIVSGGYEFESGDEFLQDRLLQNDGYGNFEPVPLPRMLSSGSCVRASDIDLDGDQDLFVGGRIVPGQYPESPQSYWLKNDGKGNFTIDRTSSLGMVTDAAWVDLNKDRHDDLVLVGEWMPVTILINEHGKFVDQSSKYIKEKTEGWWNSISTGDFDNDGDEDFIAGNFGMNNQFKATLAKPVTLYYSDFDKNGSVDPIMNYFIEGESYPSPTRDELTDQLPSFKKRFPDYQSYSKATITNVLSEAEIHGATLLNAFTFETSFFRNGGNLITREPLPFQAQFAPVFASCVLDANKDGNLDIVTGGNLSSMNARFGKVVAGYGVLLLGNGRGQFETVPAMKSGLCIKGDVRAIKIAGDKLMISRNNMTPLVLRTRSK